MIDGANAIGSIVGDTCSGSTGSSGQTQKTIAALKRKIAESERHIAAHERRTKRPVATDLQSLASVSWSSWNTPHRRIVSARAKARIDQAGRNA